MAKWRSPPRSHYNLKSFLSDRTDLRPGHALRAHSEPQRHPKTKAPVRPCRGSPHHYHYLSYLVYEFTHNYTTNIVFHVSQLQRNLPVLSEFRRPNNPNIPHGISPSGCSFIRALRSSCLLANRTSSSVFSC